MPKITKTKMKIMLNSKKAVIKDDLTLFYNSIVKDVTNWNVTQPCLRKYDFQEKKNIEIE